MSLTIRQHEALQMLNAGWTVRYSEAMDDIEWRSPRGISGSEFHSSSLDKPPEAAVADAFQNGDIRQVLLQLSDKQEDGK